MLDDWWDTKEYRKRFVPYYQKRAAMLLECDLFRPNERANILRSWHTLGEDLDRAYQLRVENGYSTEDIEEDIAFYQKCSKILQEWINHGVERAVSDTQ